MKFLFNEQRYALWWLHLSSKIKDKFQKNSNPYIMWYFVLLDLNKLQILYD